MNTDEDQELLRKIGEISGRINRHRNPQPRNTPAWNKYVALPGEQSRELRRSAPYPQQNSRQLRTKGFQNRTLIVNKGTTSAPNDELLSQPIEAGWVTKKDRHVQLINTSILDRTTQARSQAMAETRRKKALQRDQSEKQRIENFLKTKQTSTMPHASASASVHQLTIDGISFQVLKQGSKLVRLRDAADAGIPTPKQATVGGVVFMRSKHGNLYRSGVIHAARSTGAARKTGELCKHFTLYGRCAKGPQCPHNHDPAKVAICKDFLHTGSCPEGDFCDLSHDPSPERVPTCLHYLRGKCSHLSCRYAHVRVNPAAPICRRFATFGYCEKGASCCDRHIFECPSYANTGICRSENCHLPHVDRAGQIRKHAANRAEKGKEGDDEDIVSDGAEEEDEDDDDMDSDGLEEFLGADSSDEAASKALTHQEDYVGF